MSKTSPPEPFTVIVPCYNEEDGIAATVEEITSHLGDQLDYELLVINDGSKDHTGEVLSSLQARFPRLQVVEHPVNRGYGAAIKSGIRRAANEYIVITDADGSYPNDRIAELVARCRDYDMVVGARIGTDVTYSRLRAIPKYFMKHWVSWLARQRVPDINSGLRVFRRSVAERFLGVLSDQFSFTITITLSMLTNNRDVLFVPIDYYPRIGRSKIRPVRDTLRFMSLILRTGTYFAPVRAFAPIFGVLFSLALASLTYDVFILGNITDKTALFFLFSINIAMFALLADMIDKRLG